MKPVDLVAVFVRFLAASLVLAELSLITEMTETIRRLSVPGYPLDRLLLLMGAAAILAVFACAVLFWLYPMRIARFIVPKEVESELRIGFSAEQLEVCLLSLIGVYVLIQVLPQTVWFLIRIALSDIQEDPGEPRATLVFCFVKIALGVFLLLRSVGIRKVVHGLRSTGA